MGDNENNIKVINFDVDDTLVDMQHPLVAYLNKEHGTNFTAEQITHWEFLGEHFTGDEMFDAFDAIISNLHWKGDAQKVLKFFYYHPKFRAQILSATNPKSQPKRIEWFRVNAPWLDPSRINFADDKSEFPGDYLVDDAWKNASTYHSKDGRIMVNMPHNSEITPEECEKKHVVRINGVEDLISIFGLEEEYAMFENNTVKTATDATILLEKLSQENPKLAEKVSEKLLEKVAEEMVTKLITEKDIHEIARVVHEIQRHYNYLLQDREDPTWDEVDDDEKERRIELIAQTVPDVKKISAKKMHDMWMNEKKKQGWKYGGEYDLKKKTHPCIVPWDQLPDIEKAKDAMYLAVIKTMTELHFGIDAVMDDKIVKKKGPGDENMLYNKSASYIWQKYEEFQKLAAENPELAEKIAEHMLEKEAFLGVGTSIADLGSGFSINAGFPYILSVQKNFRTDNVVQPGIGFGLAGPYVGIGIEPQNSKKKQEAFNPDLNTDLSEEEKSKLKTIVGEEYASDKTASEFYEAFEKIAAENPDLAEKIAEHMLEQPVSTEEDPYRTTKVVAANNVGSQAIGVGLGAGSMAAGTMGLEKLKGVEGLGNKVEAIKHSLTGPEMKEAFKAFKNQQKVMIPTELGITGLLTGLTLANDIKHKKELEGQEVKSASEFLTSFEKIATENPEFAEKIAGALLLKIAEVAPEDIALDGEQLWDRIPLDRSKLYGGNEYTEEDAEGEQALAEEFRRLVAEHPDYNNAVNEYLSNQERYKLSDPHSNMVGNTIFGLGVGIPTALGAAAGVATAKPKVLNRIGKGLWGGIKGAGLSAIPAGIAGGLASLSMDDKYRDKHYGPYQSEAIDQVNDDAIQELLKNERFFIPSSDLNTDK